MDPTRIGAAAQQPNRMPTASAMRSSLASRRNGEIVRPMTAVRAAGYTSAGRSKYIRIKSIEKSLFRKHF
jgi:hypothetical protein